MSHIETSAAEQDLSLEIPDKLWRKVCEVLDDPGLDRARVQVRNARGSWNILKQSVVGLDEPKLVCEQLLSIAQNHYREHAGDGPIQYRAFLEPVGRPPVVSKIVVNEDSEGRLVYEDERDGALGDAQIIHALQESLKSRDQMILALFKQEQARGQAFHDMCVAQAELNKTNAEAMNGILASTVEGVAAAAQLHMAAHARDGELRSLELEQAANVLKWERASAAAGPAVKVLADIVADRLNIGASKEEKKTPAVRDLRAETENLAETAVALAGGRTDNISLTPPNPEPEPDAIPEITGDPPAVSEEAKQVLENGNRSEKLRQVIVILLEDRPRSIALQQELGEENWNRIIYLMQEETVESADAFFFALKKEMDKMKLMAQMAKLARLGEILGEELSERFVALYKEATAASS